MQSSPSQGPHIPAQLPANKSNNYRLCAAINLHNSAGIFRLNPNPFARVNIGDWSSNLPPQCLNWQCKQLIKTLPSPNPCWILNFSCWLVSHGKLGRIASEPQPQRRRSPPRYQDRNDRRAPARRGSAVARPALRRCYQR